MVIQVACDKSTRIQLQKESARIDSMIKDQMEREQQILKRQNATPLDTLDRMKLGGSYDITEELKLLSEQLNVNNKQKMESKPKKEAPFEMITETDPIKLLESFSLQDLASNQNLCRKGKHSNQYTSSAPQSEIKRSQSTEEALQEVEQAFKQSRENTLFSNRELLMEELSAAHTLCLCGTTSSFKSATITQFESMCKNPKQRIELTLQNPLFTQKLVQFQIDVRQNQNQIPQPHYLSCGVLQVSLRHSANASLTQYIPYLCFDTLPSEANQDSQQDTLSSQPKIDL